MRMTWHLLLWCDSVRAEPDRDLQIQETRAAFLSRMCDGMMLCSFAKAMDKLQDSILTVFHRMLCMICWLFFVPKPGTKYYCDHNKYDQRKTFF